MFVQVSLLLFSATLKAGLLNLFKVLLCIYNRFYIYANITLHSTPSKENKLGSMVLETSSNFFPYCFGNKVSWKNRVYRLLF